MTRSAINGPNGCKNTAGCARSDPPMFSRWQKTLWAWPLVGSPRTLTRGSVLQMRLGRTHFFLFSCSVLYIHLAQLLTKCLWFPPFFPAARLPDLTDAKIVSGEKKRKKESLNPAKLFFRGDGLRLRIQTHARRPEEILKRTALDLWMQSECLSRGSRIYRSNLFIHFSPVEHMRGI